MGEVLLAVGEIVELRVLQIDGEIETVHPLHERVPRFRIGQDQCEVDPPPVSALEDRRLRGHRLRMTAGLALHECPGVEPVRVGQLDGDPGGLLDGEVDEPAGAVLLALQQREQHGLVSEAGGGVVRLVAAGTDRRDRVIVVAGRDQQAAGGERHEVARPVVRPRPGEPEVGDRHDDQRRAGSGDRGEVESEVAQPAGMHGDDEHVGGRRAGDPDQRGRRRSRGRRRRCACRRCSTRRRGCDRGRADRRRTGRRASRARPSGGSTLITSAPRLTNCNPVISPPGSSDSSTTLRPPYGVVAGVGAAATQITPRSVRSAISSALRPEDRAVDVVVVLTEQRCRAPVVGCELRGGERHALEPGLADHRMIELEEHVAVRHLRIVLVDVLCVLHRAGAHAGCLQEVHQLVTVAPGRERGDLAVEIVLVGNSTVVRGETDVSCPRRGTERRRRTPPTRRRRTRRSPANDPCPGSGTRRGGRREDGRDGCRWDSRDDGFHAR